MPKTSLSQSRPGHFEVPLLILAAAGLLTAGLLLPILTVKQLFMTNTFSVLSGIEALWKDGEAGLAVIIFFFSVIFPWIKLAALAWLWFAPTAETTRKKVLSGLEALGRWSMLDVFVVAIVIVAVKFGWMSKANPEAGVYVFALSIFLSMTVSMWVDRLSKK